MGFLGMNAGHGCPADQEWYVWMPDEADNQRMVSALLQQLDLAFPKCTPGRQQAAG
jgi:hypothetical protein